MTETREVLEARTRKTGKVFKILAIIAFIAGLLVALLLSAIVGALSSTGPTWSGILIVSIFVLPLVAVVPVLLYIVGRKMAKNPTDRSIKIFLYIIIVLEIIQLFSALRRGVFDWSFFVSLTFGICAVYALRLVQSLKKAV